MARRSALLTLLALASAAAIAAPSFAQEPSVVLSEPQPALPAEPLVRLARAAGAESLWATVNICDTAGSPDSLGVRASMPGNGRRQRMYMRFRAMYYSGSAQAWLAVPGAGVSSWVYAGSARQAQRQAGWTFTFSPPPAGATFTMRGIVDYEWRARRRGGGGPTWTAVKRRSRITKTGVEGVDGGDPPGTSKALCLIY
jgi:hypothetical protein